MRVLKFKLGDIQFMTHSTRQSLRQLSKILPNSNRICFVDVTTHALLFLIALCLSPILATAGERPTCSDVFANRIVIEQANSTPTKAIAKWSSSFGDAVISVHRKNQTVRYERTNRGLKRLAEFYPPELIDVNQLKSQTVLDLACGNGAFIADLRAAGAKKAFGLDIALNSWQKLKNFTSGLIYYEADAMHTGLPSKTFDVIFSTYSLFTYEVRDSVAMKQAVREAKRLLKDHGRLRLSPFFAEEREYNMSLIEILKSEGFSVAVIKAPRSTHEHVVYTLEATLVDRTIEP